MFTAGRVRMLDKRPALVPDPQGGLLLIGAGTGPAAAWPCRRPRAAKDDEDRMARNPDNNNLYIVPLAAPPGRSAAAGAGCRSRGGRATAAASPTTCGGFAATVASSTGRRSACSAASSIAIPSFPPTAAPTVRWKTCGVTRWTWPTWTGWATAITIPAITSIPGG